MIQDSPQPQSNDASAEPSRVIASHSEADQPSQSDRPKKAVREEVMRKPVEIKPKVKIEDGDRTPKNTN